jgi:hypothetical protein
VFDAVPNRGLGPYSDRRSPSHRQVSRDVGATGSIWHEARPWSSRQPEPILGIHADALGIERPWASSKQAIRVRYGRQEVSGGRSYLTHETIFKSCRHGVYLERVESKRGSWDLGVKASQNALIRQARELTKHKRLV